MQRKKILGLVDVSGMYLYPKSIKLYKFLKENENLELPVCALQCVIRAGKFGESTVPAIVIFVQNVEIYKGIQCFQNVIFATVSSGPFIVQEPCRFHEFFFSCCLKDY